MELKFLQNKKFNSFQLKILACAAMLVDHLALCLNMAGVSGFSAPYGEPDEPLYLLFRAIGRLAFPIFCFLIVEGFYYTKSVCRYILRVTAAALVSEAIYDYMVFGNATMFYMTMQNVLFTFVIGLLMLYGLNLTARKFAANKGWSSLSGVIVIVVSCLLTIWLRTDYGPLGIMMLLGFYYFRKKEVRIAVYFILVTLLLGDTIQYFSLLALPFLLLYNGEKGKSAKYLFYVFFPAHMAALCLLRYFIMR